MKIIVRMLQIYVSVNHKPMLVTCEIGASDIQISMLTKERTDVDRFK